jgi:hypothetical protein
MRIAEQRADRGDGAAGDDRDASVERIGKAIDQRGEPGIDRDRLWMMLQFDKRAVEIEERAGRVKRCARLPESARAEVAEVDGTSGLKCPLALVRR